MMKGVLQEDYACSGVQAEGPVTRLSPSARGPRDEHEKPRSEAFTLKEEKEDSIGLSDLILKTYYSEALRQTCHQHALPALPFPAFFLTCVLFQIGKSREEQAGSRRQLCVGCRKACFPLLDRRVFFLCSLDTGKQGSIAMMRSCKHPELQFREKQSLY